MRPSPARKFMPWLEAVAEGSATQGGHVSAWQSSKPRPMPKRSPGPSFFLVPAFCLHLCTWTLLHPQVEETTAHRISHSNHSGCNGVETGLWNRTELGWGRCLQPMGVRTPRGGAGVPPGGNRGTLSPSPRMLGTPPNQHSRRGRARRP